MSCGREKRCLEGLSNPSPTVPECSCLTAAPKTDVLEEYIWFYAIQGFLHTEKKKKNQHCKKALQFLCTTLCKARETFEYCPVHFILLHVSLTQAE